MEDQSSGLGDHGRYPTRGMYLNCSMDEFTRIMIESGLVANGSVHADFLASIDESDKIKNSITGFTKYLIANDVLTCWQCAKLRNGQHKGFFMDSFRILDQLGHDEKCNRYLARDEDTRKYVTITVQHPTENTKRTSDIRYSVEGYP